MNIKDMNTGWDVVKCKGVGGRGSVGAVFAIIEGDKGAVQRLEPLGRFR